MSNVVEKVADEFVAVIAILAIAVIEVYALAHNINGVAMATSLAAISGIAGYKIREAKNKFKKSR